MKDRDRPITGMTAEPNREDLSRQSRHDQGIWLFCGIPARQGRPGSHSELANFRVKKTEDIVKVGDDITVKCLGVDEKRGASVAEGRDGRPRQGSRGRDRIRDRSQVILANQFQRERETVRAFLFACAKRRECRTVGRDSRRAVLHHNSQFVNSPVVC